MGRYIGGVHCFNLLNFITFVLDAHFEEVYQMSLSFVKLDKTFGQILCASLIEQKSG
jgi:hypothetical protein